MTESDAQNIINITPPRLGEIGRVVARNIRGLADKIELPSFASSLVEATQATETRNSTPATPTITAIRPGGRTLSAHEANSISPAATPAATSLPATGPMQTSSSMPTLGAAADSDANLMLMASSQSSAGVLASTTAPTGQPPQPGTTTPTGQPPAPAITGSGTRRDPLVVPYGSSKADVNAAATAVAAARESTTEIKPLALKEYPRPERDDRNGVLSWSSTTPPTGKDLDRFVSEARNRKAGYVTFEVDPGAVEQYDEVVERFTEAGIQPIVRLQDPYGDLPPEEVKQIVKDLSKQGVRYFQLFDGGNVAAETPDNRVDVRDYAERWLAAAQAVVEGGGLPGIGALAPGGDFDDRGFMRQLLSVVKERGGTDVLGQAWMALRGETPGATASTSDVEGLANRAEWYDRISRHSLGRSMPIMATLDPSGRGERLAVDPASANSNAAEQSERTIKDLRRKLPSLFGVNRGTVESARP